MKEKKDSGRCSNDPRVAFFDHQASTWDSSEQPPAETLERLAEHAGLLELGRGEDVLEVGCGTGQLTRWLADVVRPGKVTAVDFSPAMLEKAGTKDIDAEFRLADVCGDSLGRERFDVAFCFHSFPHFRDQAAALANIAGALKPAGRLIVMHLDGSAEINAFHDSVGGAVEGDHLPIGDEWERLLGAAGLREVRRIDEQGLFFLRAMLKGTPDRR